MAIPVPYIGDERMRAIAEEFLTNHHPSRKLPVPIEEIIEFQYGIDIIPMPGFHVNFEVDGFISTDLTEIRVDKAVYDARNKNRYRFTLAHELSHVVLHGDIYKQLKYGTVAEWKESRNMIPEREYSRLEFQANFLAGLILVPGDKLREAFQEASAHAEKVGIDIHQARSEAWDAIENWLATRFGVSTGVINHRAVKDGLWK